MTKVFEGYIVYTFKEWRELPHIKEWIIDQLEDTEECDNCLGSGDCQCDCGDFHSCNVCGGEGNFSNFDPRNEYEKTLREEIERLRKYIRRVTPANTNSTVTPAAEEPPQPGAGE